MRREVGFSGLFALLGAIDAKSDCLLLQKNNARAAFAPLCILKKQRKDLQNCQSVKIAPLDLKKFDLAKKI